MSEESTNKPENEAPKVFLTQKDILSIEDLLHEDVFVEEWKGWVRVRGLTAGERDRYEGSLFADVKKGAKPDFRNLRSKLVCMCLTGSDGKRLFSFNDVEKLGKKSAAAMDKLFQKAQELSGLRKEDVEELQKNLESVHLEDSASS